jgi:hypothetical protein
MTRVAIAVAALASIVACKGRGSARRTARDAATAGVVADAAPAYAWPELADLPRAEPVLTVQLPATRGTPLASVVGPTVVGDVVVIGTSQLGFVAVDWRSGTIAWRRGAGAHLAPPIAFPAGALVVGECERAPIAPTDRVVVGCWHVVSPAGVDAGAGMLAGDAAALAPFVGARGREQLVPLDDHRARWTRGDAAIDVDLIAGTAVPAPVRPPYVIARHKGREWHIAIEADEKLVARDPTGAEAWRMETAFAAVVGVLPGQAYEVPMVRVVNLHGASGKGYVDIIDIDTTGSKRGQAGTLVPGIQVLTTAFARGDSIIAVRADTSLLHDFVAAHDARGGLVWVWPLPTPAPRVDPVGAAFTDDGSVIVFFDGDRLVVLPAVSRNPTP